MIRAFALVVVLAGAALLVQGLRLAEARAAQAEAERITGGYRQAAKWRAQETAARIVAARLDMELQQGAGADVALSDYLRGAAGRVWP